MNIEVICKGVVVIRNTLSLEDQLRIINIIQQKGGLKREKEDGEEEWNFFKQRGRHFCNLNEYDKEDKQFFLEYIEKIQSVMTTLETGIPIDYVTHLLTWYYPKSKGINWHMDKYGGNDGDPDAPVYSLTIGNSCIFEFYPLDEKNPDNKNANKKSVELKSGDIIIFGGPQRLMMHQVKKILMGTFTDDFGKFITTTKDGLPFDARINLTFRKLSDFTKDNEGYYQTDNYVEKLNEKYTNSKNK